MVSKVIVQFVSMEARNALSRARSDSFKNGKAAMVTPRLNRR